MAELDNAEAAKYMSVMHEFTSRTLHRDDPVPFGSDPEYTAEELKAAAAEWTRSMKEKKPIAISVENARWHLTNKWLKPTMNSDRQFTPDDVAMIARVAKLCIYFDRQNAIDIMKIVREDPECPDGMAWITEAQFAGLEKAVAWGDKVMQSHTITSAYEKAANVVPPHDAEFLNAAMETTYPAWYRRVDVVAS